MTKYCFCKAAFGFTIQRFFKAKIQSQLRLDLISGGFIIGGFMKRGLLYPPKNEVT